MLKIGFYSFNAWIIDLAYMYCNDRSWEGAGKIELGKLALQKFFFEEGVAVLLNYLQIKSAK